MQLSFKSFNQLIQDMGAALQGSATNLVDVSVGSVLRAIFEANAAVALWIQSLILQVLSMTRAATSVGVDLDSWMADYNFARLAATPSTGSVTLSRYSTNMPALVPVGTLLKSSDGTLNFSIARDTTLSTWQPSSSGYLVPAGVASIDLPAVCLSDGTPGNVLASAITTIASSLPGIDQVVNIAPFVNGTDPESDQAFRTRFQSYLSSLARATLSAVEGAVTNVQQGLSFLVKENTLPNGLSSAGSFLIFIDDGSGFPPGSLMSSVATAVELVRPVGTTYSVIAPAVQSVNVTLSASASVGVPSSYVQAVQQKITQYINSLPIEHFASVTRVAQAAYNADPYIDNVANVTLNGSATDLPPLSGTVFKAGQITVAMNAG